ncbi:DUF3826 domain-containing protein [Hymenobacter cavernae]|uniref:DUF3826 domain-containing protein n=1 Tax=Hymenobacter cavernae TaxID=2044852 RepID=A0ABQ1U6V5_9BACT|nr:DUF3826 domain-containing protein [Hymenobacter cavernae]GGF11583.1 hypothetical protein GCM10011383_23440 [Hymenobacter cavernae]
MPNIIRSLFLAGILAASTPSLAWAQAQPTETAEAAYTRTITERAGKIVEKINGLDAKKAPQVRDLIAGQYRQLNEIYEHKKTQLTALKAKPQDESTAAEKQKIEAAVTADVAKLHKKYVSKLSKALTPEQVDQVKDGMTYGVLPLTMRAYQEMLPTLTEAQKTQILAWLTEAREHAMDGGTSQEKHAWFGKYKGKINNYLSAAGIDMKQAGKDWAERRAAAGNASN